MTELLSVSHKGQNWLSVSMCKFELIASSKKASAFVTLHYAHVCMCLNDAVDTTDVLQKKECFVTAGLNCLH